MTPANLSPIAALESAVRAAKAFNMTGRPILLGLLANAQKVLEQDKPDLREVKRVTANLRRAIPNKLKRS